MGAKNIQVCWSAGLIPSLCAWAAQIKHRQINDWLTPMCEPLSCWQLCQGDCSCRAQLLLTVQGKLLFLLEKLQRGQTSLLYCSSSSRDLTLLRSGVREWLKESVGKAPSEEEQFCCPRLADHTEIMVKKVCGEGSQWGKAVLLSQAHWSSWIHTSTPQNAAGSLWVLLVGKGAQFWGGKNHLFVAPCNSVPKKPSVICREVIWGTHQFC